MSSHPMSDLAAVADAIRANDRFLVVTHENPDGDALGSLLGLKRGLDRLGKDSVMFVGGETTIPQEYSFLELDEISRVVPDDAAGRVLLAVDCANESRMGSVQQVLDRVPLAVDVDHHHDNSRFGHVNLIVPDASSSGEIVRDILRELSVELTPQIA